MRRKHLSFLQLTLHFFLHGFLRLTHDPLRDWKAVKSEGFVAPFVATKRNYAVEVLGRIFERAAAMRAVVQGSHAAEFTQTR